MLCPLCKTNLEKLILCNVEIDYCSGCLGIWFEEEELRMAKDEKDKDLSWLDIDLWEQRTRFKISPGQKLCPFCRLPLYEVNYGDSKIKVDVCNLCHGTWLDRGEFKKIIEYLKAKANYKILNQYTKNLLREVSEIFIGPESFREEILDFLAILKVLNYKFAVHYPAITKIISTLPK